ncbi:hypothetical protein HGRIS_001319 [Hohenbuehelia grisea]|uniref:F-box domain-containing protein n=1 Tax=Hohenbuehelia grisea TaxID=104357 RepID=A0ABR3JNY3_9AGAR
MSKEGPLRSDAEPDPARGGSHRFNGLKRVSWLSLLGLLSLDSRVAEPAALRESGPSGLTSVLYNDTAVTAASQHKPMGNIPVEIYRRIIGYTVRLAGASLTNLEDPFKPGECEDVLGAADPDMLADRRCHLSICRDWRLITLEIVSEYVSIFSPQQLSAMIKLLAPAKKGRKRASRASGYGRWTLRIDLHVSLDPYPAKQIVKLIQCAPNLQVFTVHDKHPSERPHLRQTAPEVIRALTERKKLKRLDWTSQETITWHDVVTLSRNLPLLESFRLFCLYTYQGIETAKIPPHFPNLKTLALGPIPMPTTPLPPPLPWNYLLTSLSVSPKQLPCLERLDIESFPEDSCPFIQLHGERIKHLRTTTYTLFESNRLRTYLPLFPSLDTLVVSHGSEFEFIRSPPTHSTLRRICVVPLVEDLVEVPYRIFSHAVLTPLEGIMMIFEDMRLPNLQMLRIENIGALADLEEHPAWLQLWWRRWTLRGVRFEDKNGNIYRTARRDDDALLNSVRG